MASIFWYTHSWGTIFLAIDFGYIVVVTVVFAKTEYLDLDPEPRLEMGISTYSPSHPLCRFVVHHRVNVKELPHYDV